MFDNWAQPVTNKPWGIVTAVAFTLSRLSGYRYLNGFKARSWERACGLR